jgi:hypothetical protein
MHEMFRKRLEALEGARKLQRLAMRSIYIVFKGASWETKEASGPANFVCHRHDGEPLSDFEDRCDSEFRIAYSRWPLPPIFVFGPGRDKPLESIG